MTDKDKDTTSSVFEGFFGKGKKAASPKEGTVPEDAPMATVQGAAGQPLNAELVERYDAYGIDRTRKNEMLEVQLKNNMGVVIPFHDIRGVTYAGNHTIVIHATIGTVTIEGNNLKKVLAFIRNHEIDYVRESKAPEKPDAVFVQAIRFEEL